MVSIPHLGKEATSGMHHRCRWTQTAEGMAERMRQGHLYLGLTGNRSQCREQWEKPPLAVEWSRAMDTSRRKGTCRLEKPPLAVEWSRTA